MLCVVSFIVAVGCCEYDREGSATPVYQEVYLRSFLASVGGLVARFLPSQRSRRVFGIHGLPLPRDPAALPCVVLGHPLHELLEDAHLSPLLEAFVDHAGGHSEPITMNGLPLASRPKDIPDSVDDSPVRDPRPATFPTPVPFLFGQTLFEFPPQGAGEIKVVHAPGCGSLSHVCVHLLRWSKRPTWRRVGEDEWQI